MSRVGDEYVLFSDTEKVPFYATGGQAPEPTGGNGPFAAGSTAYIFSYTELSGDPASGVAGSTSNLVLDRNPDGYTDVTAELEQEWVCADNSTVKTKSPPSDPVPVKVQTPTTAVQKGDGDTLDGTGQPQGYVGKVFSHDVNDQTGEILKNAAGRTVLESLTFQAQVASPQVLPILQKYPVEVKTDEPIIYKLSDQGQIRDPIATDPIPLCQTFENAANQNGLSVPVGGSIFIQLKAINHTYKLAAEGGSPEAPLKGTFNRKVTIEMKKQQDGSYKLSDVKSETIK